MTDDLAPARVIVNGWLRGQHVTPLGIAGLELRLPVSPPSQSGVVVMNVVDGGSHQAVGFFFPEI
jgi:hypothetical protein